MRCRSSRLIMSIVRYFCMKKVTCSRVRMSSPFLPVKYRFPAYSYCPPNQPLFGEGGLNILLDGVETFVNDPLCFGKLLFQRREVGVFLALQVYHNITNIVENGIIVEHVHRFIDDNVLNPVFAYRLFFAAPKLFHTDAFVILVDTVAASTALAHHEHNGRKIAWWSICLFLCRLEAGRDFLFFSIRSSTFSK